MSLIEEFRQQKEIESSIRKMFDTAKEYYKFYEMNPDRYRTNMKKILEKLTDMAKELAEKFDPDLVEEELMKQQKDAKASGDKELEKCSRLVGDRLGGVIYRERERRYFENIKEKNRQRVEINQEIDTLFELADKYIALRENGSSSVTFARKDLLDHISRLEKAGRSDILDQIENRANKLCEVNSTSRQYRCANIVLGAWDTVISQEKEPMSETKKDSIISKLLETAESKYKMLDDATKKLISDNENRLPREISLKWAKSMVEPLKNLNRHEMNVILDELYKRKDKAMENGDHNLQRYTDLAFFAWSEANNQRIYQKEKNEIEPEANEFVDYVSKYWKYYKETGNKDLGLKSMLEDDNPKTEELRMLKEALSGISAELAFHNDDLVDKIFDELESRGIKDSALAHMALDDIFLRDSNELYYD